MPTLRLDLVTAAVEKLRAFPPFQQLVGDGLIGTDAAADASLEDKLEAVWLFQKLNDDGRPYRDPEGSGTGVVVLAEREPWTGRNNHNTAHFRTLQMLIYMDSTRGEDGEALILDADRKCKHVYAEIDPCFHLVANQPPDRRWPGRFVHRSTGNQDLSITDVPGTQSQTVRGQATYNTITDY